MHEHATGGLCSGCGSQLEPEDAATAPYCAQCALDRAEHELASRQTNRALNAPDTQRQARTRRTARIAALWTLAILAAAVIAWRAPMVFSAVQPPKPIRTGVQSTNRAADRCIANLWIASGRLSEGTAAAAGLTCPASGKPYSAVKSNGTLVISCPNPAEHGLRSLSVTSVSLVPEAN